MGVSIANAKNRLPELIRAVEDEDVAIMLVDPENDVTFRASNERRRWSGAVSA